MRSLVVAVAALALAVTVHGQQNNPQAEADQLTADLLAEWTTVNVGSWSGLVQQDPITDEIGIVMLRTEQDALLACGFEDGVRGPRLRLSNIPRLGVDSANVTYRIGRDAPQTAVWSASTGDSASSLIVPDGILEEVLLAGRIVIRVGDTTRVYEWQGGDDALTLVRGCTAP